MLRLLLVPVIVHAIQSHRLDWAVIGFAAAGLSDAADGFIARRFNQRSKLGAYLDPLADKLLLVSVFVVLGMMGRLPAWLVILAVSRDGLIVLGLALSHLFGRPMRPHPILVSKANTAGQIALAGAVLADLALVPGMAALIAPLVALSAVLTVASAAAYLLGWLQHMNGYGETRSATD